MAEEQDGMKVTKPRWSRRDDLILSELYGSSPKESLLKVLPGRSWDAIVIHSGKLGLSRLGYAAKQERESDISDLISGSPVAWYWVGFLLADGHFDPIRGRVKIGLAMKDAGHLAKLASFVKCPNLGLTDIAHLSFQDQRLISFCQKHSIVSDKTVCPPDLESFPEDAWLPLFSGFVDGDGHVHCRNPENFRITVRVHGSWLGALGFFEDRVYERTMPDRHSKRLAHMSGYGYALLNITDNPTIRCLVRKIRELKLPVMDRKWGRIPLTTAYENFTSEVMALHSTSLTVSEIAEKLKCRYTRVFHVIYKHRAKIVSSQQHP